MKKTENKKLKVKDKVVIAMSGGVDSSVAAAILVNQGFNVIGVFLKFWKDTSSSHSEENICCDQEALHSAGCVAEKLKIPFYVLDASKEFKKEVVDYYIEEYDNGRTPNPCAVCNKFIKFGRLFKKAKALGANYLATGHYARLAYNIKTQNSKLKFSTQSVKLLEAKDKKKDQSYFLWRLSQDQLRNIMFPIGDLSKPDVRKLASKFELPTAQKKESHDICFIPKGNNPEFLANYSQKLNKPGNIIDLNGVLLGGHKGLVNYTIGQRHGLEGIQLKLITNNQKLKNIGIPPAYVIKLDVEKNELIVGEKKDLYRKELIAENINWIYSCSTKHVTCNMGLECQAKIRYGHQSAECRVLINDKFPNKAKIIFKNPQKAITPGQSVVFYRGRELIGGGIIKQMSN